MAKQLSAHEDYANVTVVVAGVPISLDAEVDIVLKRPTKLDNANKAAWDQINTKNANYITVRLASVVKGTSD